MSDTTARHALPLIAAGQAQKDVTHNEALSRVDALLHLAVESTSLAAPPADAAPGQSWLVPAGAEAAWGAAAGTIMTETGNGWDAFAARAGMTAWDQGNGRFLWYDGNGWRGDGWPSGGLNVAGTQRLAATPASIADVAGGSVVDVQARAAVNQLLALMRAQGLVSG